MTTAQRLLPHLTRHTDIWLVVSVPVLSEQITEVQPSVSTEGRLRTMAFFRAILRVPRARQVVMTAGRPDGNQRGLSWTSSEPTPVLIRAELPHRESPGTGSGSLLLQQTGELPSGMAATANATAILK